MAIARRHGLRIVEDAAQGIMASYKGRALGAIGDLGSFSFHETKNIMSGEGGSLLVNDPELVLRAEIIREKGTDRGRFFRGEVDKYTWLDSAHPFCRARSPPPFSGPSSRRPSTSPPSGSRSGSATTKCSRRSSSKACFVARSCPRIAGTMGTCITSCCDPCAERQKVLDGLKENGIHAVFHYVPLHSSPAGMRFGRAHGDLSLTTSLSERLVRLPMWLGLERGPATAGMRGIDRDLEKIDAGQRRRAPIGVGHETVRFAVLRRRTGGERRIGVSPGAAPVRQGGHGGNAGNAGRTVPALEDENLGPVGLLEGHFARQHRTQLPAGMAIALMQANESAGSSDRRKPRWRRSRRRPLRPG